jgi:hypothetical protein
LLAGGIVGDEGRSESSIAPGAITALLREAFRAPQRPGGGISGFRPGVVVGRFELVRMLGRGGFGVVFEAIDRTLGRAVAFKGVRTVGDVHGNAEMLLREAEAAAQLSHPNIVVLHDVGHCEHGPYLVMELLRGRTLADRLVDGALPVEEALHVAREVAKGVAHAHARRVVHRDLKPGNVFLCDDGQVKVLDFGMARIFGRPKVDGGTIAYMAPEQRRGDSEDERTDVFALGVMLHEMLAGARPPGEPGADGDALTGLVLPAGADRLSALVSRMIAPAPDDRPRDGGEVLAAIREAERAPAPRERAGLRRAPMRIAAAAGAMLVAAALALVLGRSAPTRGGGPTTAPTVAGAARPEPAPAPAADHVVEPPRPVAAPSRPVRRPQPAQPPRSAPPGQGAVRYCRASVGSIATPRSDSGEGVLVVVADPFGEVFVDGERHGETPSECLVSAGPHLVRTIHAQYGAREARVEVAAGQRARFAADFLGDR